METTDTSNRYIQHLREFKAGIITESEWMAYRIYLTALFHKAAKQSQA